MLFFFLCQGWKHASMQKPVSFDISAVASRIQRLLRLSPPFHCICWDLRYSGAVLWYASVSLWEIWYNYRDFSGPPPSTSQTSHPATMDKSTYINLYLLRHLLPRCACQGWAVNGWKAGSQPDSTGWMNTHRIHGNGIFTFMKTIKINPQNQPTSTYGIWLSKGDIKGEWIWMDPSLSGQSRCITWWCICIAHVFAILFCVPRSQKFKIVYDFKSKCIHNKHTFIQRFMVEYLQHKLNIINQSNLKW